MVVVFDVDHTLTAANCTAALARAMAAAGLVPRSELLSLAVQQALYRVGWRAFPDLMARAYGLLVGKDVAQVQACAERVVRDAIAPALYPDAVSRIAAHRASGHRVVLASAAPEIMVARVARCVDVTDVIATTYDRVGARFGGVITPAAHGEGKVELLRRAGLLLGDRPHVYTDHVADWPLVQASRFVTLVNPAPGFLRDVRRRGLAHEVVRWSRA
ncbi:MAG: HAD-IB family hydrolase [Vicinamibacterales bacterium]